MPKPIARPIVLAIWSCVLGCGPGGFAGAGSEFGEAGTADDEIGDPSTSGMSDPNPTSGSDSSDDGLSTETETETETGADDWTDPGTETGDDTDEPELIDADCSRVWTVLDSKRSHGHIGATPIGPGPSGAFVSVNPVLASEDGVNVDSWIRSWTPAGELLWESQVSWADHRDDPLALLSDDLGDVYLGGRINANTFEDAMVAKLDGQTGEVIWTFLRGEAGGYASIAENGAALVVAGKIGGFSGHWLELMALEPETGEVLWVSEPEEVFDARGLVVAEGKLDLLVARSLGNQNSVEILRYQPLATTPEPLVLLLSHSGPVAVLDLERFGDDQLAAVFAVGPDSHLRLVDRASGEVSASLKIDPVEGATTVIASELVELPGGQGLGIAGTVALADEERQTFIMRVDPQLEVVCTGVLSRADLGVSRSPLLRGLVAGDDGALYTGSFVDTPIRLGAFARWE
ncbi:MAG: PQQ-binding-like beta-propeller repeat protein [Enhygromyxa sp.]